MPNPSGKNSPESFDEFTPTKAHGSQQRGNDMRKQAPLAGAGQSGHMLNTAREAAEIATKSAKDQIDRRNKERAAQGPDIPEAPPQAPSGDPVAATWQEIAATPGASELVKQYATSV